MAPPKKALLPQAERETITLTFIGMTPLLMHNGELANPRNPYASELRQIRKQKKEYTKKGSTMTEEQYEQLLDKEAEAQWRGGFYYFDGTVPEDSLAVRHGLLTTDDIVGPYVPSQNVRASFIAAATHHRHGTKMQGALGLTGEFRMPLLFPGARTKEALAADPAHWDTRTVRIQQARVPQTRPVFNEWAILVDVTFYADAKKFQRELILEHIYNAGTYGGLGDGRKLGFGQFRIEEGVALRAIPWLRKVA